MADFRIDSVKNLYGVDGRGCISDEMPGCPVEADGGCIRTNINYLTASLRHSTSVRAVFDADCFAATLRKSDQSPFCPWALLGHMCYWVSQTWLTLARTSYSDSLYVAFGLPPSVALKICQNPVVAGNEKNKLQSSTFGCLSATTLLRKQRSCRFA